ncbi:hypothetical protein ACSBR1_001924 [Camellia fascicularis]
MSAIWNSWCPKDQLPNLVSNLEFTVHNLMDELVHEAELYKTSRHLLHFLKN